LAVSSAKSGTRRISSKLDSIDILFSPSGATAVMGSYNRSNCKGKH
jgi:hypothetical protein